MAPSHDDSGRRSSSHDRKFDGTLAKAESIVERAREVSKVLFKEAKRMPEYKRVLATRERCIQFDEKLKDKAERINTRLKTKLPDDVLADVAIRLSSKLAMWEHSPIRQRERQKKQVAKRRRNNRGRDLRILRFHEDGLSQRRIAKEVGCSRGAVERVLRWHYPPPDKKQDDTSAAG